MTEKLTFSVENIELLDESNDSQFATLRIDAFATGENAHDLYVSETALKNAAKTILEKPIVWKYSSITDDAMSHEKDEYAVGFIPKDTAIDFRTLDDGRIMMSIVGKLWTRYSGKLMEIFQRDKSKSVSVEIEVLEENKKSLYGISEIVAFCFRAITVLGQMVRPAIAGAKADLVAFAIQEETEYQEAYNLEFSNKYADIDFTIPKKIKLNVQKALEEYRINGKNANSVHLAMARFLTKNEKATPEKIKSMFQFFNRKVQYDDITIGFYGSKEGMKWSKEIMNKLEEIDNKQLFYFSEKNIVTFPYSKIEDAPENMKKLDGVPLTLEQINQIAKVADAIGVNKEKNGYAIAKSQFKKGHKIKNGKWVKMSDDEIEEFAKAEDLGKGKALKVNKSKEEVSNSSWESVDKTSLMHKVLNASNYKSLVHDVYLIVEEGWEEHPSSSLKYPVMQVSNDELVYNKHGLSAALGRAKQQGEDGVVSKVESIQSKLELNKSEKEDMSVENDEKLKDEKFEEIKDDEKEKEKEETVEEEKEEEEKEKEEEKEEEHKEENMSLDGNLDVSAYLGFLENATEVSEEMAAKYKETDGTLKHEVIHRAAYDKMCKMANDLKKAEEDKDVYMSEIKDLREFKNKTEKEKFNYELETTFAEVSDVLPKEELKNFREESVNYSLENLDELQNKIKAVAFSYTGKAKKFDDGINRVALSWANQESSIDLTHGWVK